MMHAKKDKSQLIFNRADPAIVPETERVAAATSSVSG
jgi:hypothetical protein